MNTNRFSIWLSLGANLAVLVGLMLVAYEINQSTRATRADMISTYQDRWIMIDLSWQEGDIAAAWAKAMEEPAELTVAEMVQLNGFMWSFMDQMDSHHRMWELGVFDESVSSPEVMISNNAHIFFGNKFSQAWLEEKRKSLSMESLVIIDELMPGMSVTDSLESYQRIKSRIVEN